MTHPDDLETRLRNAERQLEGSYDKRTEHLQEDGRAVFINRLILEDSPYLLQHAHNPVNWYPWGTEAFAEAQRSDKPIFLSIGYSTCHWCHVMEVETFDNVEVAKVLNEHFISIKMDREQYPDIDEIYMTGVQIMSGQGGWPMSNFLLPDGRPFFGGTYFPAPTFLQLLAGVRQAWHGKRSELETSADSIDQAIKKLLGNAHEHADLQDGIDELIVKALLEREDKTLGGLAGEPKFPQEPLLLFLLQQAASQADEDAMAFVHRALKAMACGGIYDQVAGGFHRYSVDAQWLVPHFEKMLYNQSQLGQVYLRAWQLSGDVFYARIVKQTLDYVLRDLQIEEGGFYSATDADSEGAEGIFFIWTPAQLAEALSADEYELITAIYDISEQGNFEGANILELKEPLTDSDLMAKLDVVLEKLYQTRELREHPLRDDKLIVGWNGAMINTLALAGWHMRDDSWIAAASKAAEAICASNLDQQGRLQRISLNGTSSIAGQLEDYANLAEGLITLFDVLGERNYLDLAAGLADTVLEDFYDADSASLFLSPVSTDTPQLVRSSNAGDGATISPVATMLACLHALSARAEWLNKAGHRNPAEYGQLASRVEQALAPAINEQALAHSSMLRVVGRQQQAEPTGFAYIAGGLARISARRSADTVAQQGQQKRLLIEIAVHLQDGWHVITESESRLQAYSLALTDDSVWQIVSVEKPGSNADIDDGSGGKIAGLGGEFSITLDLQRQGSATAEQLPMPRLELSLQLCEHGRCLLPETVTLLP